MNSQRKLAVESLEDRIVMTTGFSAMWGPFELSSLRNSAYESFLNPVQLNGGTLEIDGSGYDDYVTVKNEDGMVKVRRLSNAGSFILMDMEGNPVNATTYEFDPDDVDEIFIEGFAGNDTIKNLTSIESTIKGGSGNDYLRGGSDDDVISGGLGNDRIYGQQGDDEIDGGYGDDRIYSSYGDDVIDGGPGADRIYSSYGDDVVDGGSGRDQIYGGSGDDVVRGGSGSDQLYGNGGEDQLFAGTGSDTLSGGSGKDILISLDNSGGDQMTGNSGNDVFWGDSNDTVTDSNSHENKYAKHLIDSFENGADKTLNGDSITPDGALFESDEVFRDFGNKSLFSEDGPMRTDIEQGNEGNCWLMAGIGTIAHDNPERILDSVVDFGDGSYGVNLNDKYFRVDGQLAVYDWSADDTNPIPRYAGLGEDDVLWPAIVEKAWSESRFDWPWGLNAGWTGSVWEAFDGTDEAVESFGWFSDGTDVINHINDALNDGKVVTILTQWFDWQLDSDDLVKCHYYMVDSVNMADETITIVNPHGSSSSNPYEVTMSAEELYDDLFYGWSFGGVQTATI
jgi:hypothetical protein